jgi:hypothetical protein
MPQQRCVAVGLKTTLRQAYNRNYPTTTPVLVHKRYMQCAHKTTDQTPRPGAALCLPLTLDLLQFRAMEQACASTAELADYIKASGLLVHLLLERCAKCNARATGGLAGLTPLHITSCWPGSKWG